MYLTAPLALHERKKRKFGNDTRIWNIFSKYFSRVVNVRRIVIRIVTRNLIEI